MHAFILAGGFATRLWPLTEKRAKPLLPLAGKPIITHIVEKIPEDIPVTVSTNAVFKDGFEEWKKEMGRSNLEILIEDTLSDDQKLGALGAVSQWIEDETIDEDVLLLAGDNYVGFSIEEFIRQYNDKPKYNGKPFLALHDIGEKEKAKKFGTVITDGKGKVTGFEEKPQEPKTTNVSTGVYIIPKGHFDALIAFAKKKPDNIGGIFEHFLEQKTEVMNLAFNEPWFDIGSFEAYLEATRELVGENMLREEGANIDHTNYEGSVVVGSGSRVSKSNLKDVVIFEGSTIEDCNLENCIIDLKCTLKGVDLRGKMIRENTNLTS